MYWVVVAKGRIFVDGNNRTAVAVCLLFLRRNGIQPYNRSDLEEAAFKVAFNQMTVSALADYLRSSFSN